MEPGIGTPCGDVVSASAKIEALLFDLGGVVLDIDFERALRRWTLMSGFSFEELKTRFVFDAAYERHEQGELRSGDYFGILRRRLKLEGSDAQIAAGWNGIFAGKVPGSLEAIRRARARLPCYAFTNSNPVHQAAWTAAYPEVVAAFDRVFVSCELGLRKPERAAFAAVSRAIGVAAQAILFFDDTLENVLGARRAGLQAVHVRSPEELRIALAHVDSAPGDLSRTGR